MEVARTKADLARLIAAKQTYEQQTILDQLNKDSALLEEQKKNEAQRKKFERDLMATKRSTATPTTPREAPLVVDAKELLKHFTDYLSEQLSTRNDNEVPADLDTSHQDRVHELVVEYFILYMLRLSNGNPSTISQFLISGIISHCSNDELVLQLMSRNEELFFKSAGTKIKGDIAACRLPTTTDSLLDIFKESVVPESYKSFAEALFHSQRLARGKTSQNRDVVRNVRMMVIFSIVKYHFNSSHNDNPLLQEVLTNLMTISSTEKVLEVLNVCGMTFSVRNQNNKKKDAVKKSMKMWTDMISLWQTPYKNIKPCIVAHVDNLDHGQNHFLLMMASKTDPPIQQTDKQYVKHARSELTVEKLITEVDNEVSMKSMYEQDRLRRALSLCHNAAVSTNTTNIDNGSIDLADLTKSLEVRHATLGKRTKIVQQLFNDQHLKSIHMGNSTAQYVAEFDRWLLQMVDTFHKDNPELPKSDLPSSRLFFQRLIEGKAGNYQTIREAFQLFEQTLPFDTSYIMSSDGQVFLEWFKNMDKVVVKKLDHIRKLKASVTAAEQLGNALNIALAREALDKAETDYFNYLESTPMQLGPLHTCFTAIRAIFKVNGELYRGVADMTGLESALSKMMECKTGYCKLSIEFLTMLQQGWLCEVFSHIEATHQTEGAEGQFWGGTVLWLW